MEWKEVRLGDVCSKIGSGATPSGGKKMKKLLIIYYSWSNGNTERIAKMLQSETDSDILKIDTVVPYSGSYDDVVNQGQNEVQRGYEPEIKPLDINIARNADISGIK